MGNRSVILSNIQFFSFSLLVILQLFGWPLGVNILLLVLGISVFFNPNFKAEFGSLIKNKVFLLVIIPFLLYAFSLLFSSDINEGIRNVTTKLPLLLFPFIINMLFNPKEDDLWNVAKLFIWCVALMGIFGFCIQYQEYLKVNDSGLFYNDNLGSAFGKQAVYFAWYVNSAICILLFGWNKIISDDQRFSFFGTVLLMILIGIQILLASRTSLAIMLVTLSFFGLYKVFKGTSKKKIILAFLSISLLIITTIFVFPKVLNRFKSIAQISYRLDNPNPLNHFNGTYSKDNWDGLSARLAIWECSWSAIKKQPLFGFGVGDVRNELKIVYHEKNFILGESQGYNTHNQFFDVFLTTGIVGLIVFTLVMFSILKISIQQKNLIITSLLIILILSMLTENILNRNQGVMIVGLILGFTIKILSAKRLKKL